MSIDNRLFDDLTRVAGGAASILSAVGKQIGEGLKDQMGDKFNFPSSSAAGFSAANDDVERLQGVVTKLRMEQEDLKARIATLESMLNVKPKASAPAKNAPAKASAPKAKKATNSKTAKAKSAPAKKAPAKKTRSK